MKFNRELAREKGLKFQILSDPGNEVASRFKLAYEVPADLREIYRKFGLDLPRFNGDDSWKLPMPARFVIDREGIIRDAEVSADYTVRPEPEDTLQVLKNLGK